MPCNTCTKRGQCGFDPANCDEYFMDPEAALKLAVQEEMPAKPGVISATASVHGSMLKVLLCVHPNMYDDISKDLYAAVVSRIIQRILDESDGRSQVEYADVVFTVGDK